MVKESVLELRKHKSPVCSLKYKINFWDIKWYFSSFTCAQIVDIEQFLTYFIFLEMLTIEHKELVHAR